MTNTAKTLTFVIPAYNMESYLDRCVNSLLSASDTRDLEVLIVDDGSKDGTLEYARKLERTNPGVVRAIHQENKGHGGAVNTGIAAATGMYVKVVMRTIGSTRRPSTRFWPRCARNVRPASRSTCW